MTGREYYSEIDVNQCYLRGTLTLSNGYQLHIAEYVITDPSIVRTKYRYHLQYPRQVKLSSQEKRGMQSREGTLPN